MGARKRRDAQACPNGRSVGELPHPHISTKSSGLPPSNRAIRTTQSDNRFNEATLVPQDCARIIPCPMLILPHFVAAGDAPRGPYRFGDAMAIGAAKDVDKWKAILEKASDVFSKRSLSIQLC